MKETKYVIERKDKTANTTPEWLHWRTCPSTELLAETWHELTVDSPGRFEWRMRQIETTELNPTLILMGASIFTA